MEIIKQPCCQYQEGSHRECSAEDNVWN